MTEELNNQRLHLMPTDRLATAATVSCMVGAGQGFFEGVKTASLRYLTENAHRLPRTVGGWYFYHKKKNYVMLFSGLKIAAQRAIKYSVGVSAFVGLEAGLDYARGTTDFLNTTVVGAVLSYAHGSLKQMTRVQKLNHVKKGTAVACLFGLSQDLMIYLRGGNVWYTRIPSTSMDKLQL